MFHVPKYSSFSGSTLVRFLYRTPQRNSTVGGCAEHILCKVQSYGNSDAIYNGSKVATYSQLLDESSKLSSKISKFDLKEKRIAFVTARDHSYVIALWAIWQAGCIAVPIHAAYPPPEIEYVLRDCQASDIIVHDDYLPHIEPVAAKLRINIISIASKISKIRDSEVSLKEHHFEAKRRALILYTSGTTGRPKGVVTTHGSITSQINDIVSAWEINRKDFLLHVLPLHHTHGVVNKLLCPLYAGGRVKFLSTADASSIWETIVLQYSNDDPINVFMAVPTIYMNLLEEFKRLNSITQEKALEALTEMRLCVSGSMACPLSVIEKWKKFTGHTLLERYGMTETGMVLTNPLNGTRHPGYVGNTFPSVDARIVDSTTEREVIESNVDGELRVRGPSIFKEYWNREAETRAAFDADRWFRTGDVAEYDREKNSYRIIGRASVDIIKSGGYKISAVDIERIALSHRDVAECYVFGVKNEKWGEIVCAIVRFHNFHDVDTSEQMESLKDYLKSNLASYKVPKRIEPVQHIPKNAMGKVNKKQLSEKFCQS